MRRRRRCADLEAFVETGADVLTDRLVGWEGYGRLDWKERERERERERESVCVYVRVPALINKGFFRGHCMYLYVGVGR
jgi:hypothetical protein